MLSRFYLIPERNVTDGQTQTDGQICYTGRANKNPYPLFFVVQ